MRELPERGADHADGAVLPASCIRVREVLPRPTRGVRGAGRDLLRVRLLLRVLGGVGGARAPVRRDDPQAARARTRGSRRRGGVQRRLSAAALHGHGYPGARHRSGRQRGPRRGGARSSDARRVLRPRDRATAGLGGQEREPHRREQRPRTSPRPQRLRRRRQDPPARLRGRRRSSFRTFSASSTGSSTTRSTTSTSRTSPSRRSARSFPRTGSRSTTSRSCGRTADRFASMRSIPAARTRERTP